MSALQLLALALLAGTVVFAVIALLIGRNRYPAGASYMALTMAGVAVWLAGGAGEVLTAADAQAYRILRLVKYTGVVVVMPGFLLFVVRFTKPEARLRVLRPALFALAALTWTVALTNPLHFGMWAAPAAPVPPGGRTVFGPWFSYVHAPVSYLCVAAAAVLLLREMVRGRREQRVQAGVLLAAALVPTLVNAVYVYSPGMPDVQQTPMAFGFTALVAGWGFFRFRLFQVSPLALQAVFGAVDQAVVVVDPAGRVADANPLAGGLLGLDGAQATGRRLADLDLPVDLAGIMAEGGASEVTLVDGTVLSVEATAIRDADGVQRGHVIVARDTTGRRNAEEALRQSEARLRGVIEQSPNGIILARPYYTPEGRLREFFCVLGNPAAARYLDRPLEALPGASLTSLAPPHTGLLFDTLRRVAQTGERRDVEVSTRMGERDYWFRVSANPVGEDIAITIINVTAAKERELTMRAAAVEDPLTGLLNRRGFEEDAAALLVESGDAPARPCTLFYLDLDGFKAVNDRFGHAAGDALLVEMAARVRRCVRAQDLVARFGGDEFVVLATDCGPVEAALLMARFRTAMEEAWATEDGREVALSASIGQASAAAGEADLPLLLRQADAAMYERKRAVAR